jgi:hypothetical protein
MSELRDPLIEAIHAAGEVPPAPDRDAAFARAMHAVFAPSRRRLNRSVIALFAAALLAVPAAVFAERAAHTPPATITPITFEKPDPRSSIHREADDSTVKRENAASGMHSGSVSGTDDHVGNSTGSSSSGSDDHSSDGTTPSGSDSSGHESDDLSTPAPAPVPSATPGLAGSDGSPDGGTLSPDGGSSGTN